MILARYLYHCEPQIIRDAVRKYVIVYQIT
jgi:hypothetical protein